MCLTRHASQYTFTGDTNTYLVMHRAAEAAQHASQASVLQLSQELAAVKAASQQPVQSQTNNTITIPTRTPLTHGDNSEKSSALQQHSSGVPSPDNNSSMVQQAVSAKVVIQACHAILQWVSHAGSPH